MLITHLCPVCYANTVLMQVVLCFFILSPVALLLLNLKYYCIKSKMCVVLLLVKTRTEYELKYVF